MKGTWRLIAHLFVFSHTFYLEVNGKGGREEEGMGRGIVLSFERSIDYAAHVAEDFMGKWTTAVMVLGLPQCILGKEPW